MIDMQYRSQLLGAPMFSSWSGNVFGDKLEEYTEMYDKKIRPLIRDGDLYHTLPRADGIHWDGFSYIDSDSKNKLKGCVFVFKPSGDADDSVLIRLNGLDSDKIYTLTFEDHTEQNFTATGKSLMENGFSFTITDTIGSDIIWIYLK